MKALEVNNLSKSFTKYHSRFDLFVDMIFNTNRSYQKTVIENMSFSVNKGETFGILGDNGSGKTVILKLLAKQLLATDGEIVHEGKLMRHSYMTGMIETKTGYENIYYKCGLHGLREYEIDAIVRDIVIFSELGDAINDQYASYSTSMRSKLGFAIAIHLQADIILMDEAFAVGDGSYRKKCNDKFYELKRQGMTVIYASYSHHSIKASCDRAMWVADGNIICIGNPTRIAKLYESYLLGEKTIDEITHGLDVGLYAVH